MYFKWKMESWLTKLGVRSLLLAFFFSLILNNLVFCQERVIERIVALVESNIITLTDVQIASAFDLFNLGEKEKKSNSLAATLEKIIDLKVVLHLAKEEEMELDDEIFEESWKKWRAGLGEDKFVFYQKVFGVSEEDLKTLLKEKLIFDRLIQRRVALSIPVSIEEIRSYYQNVYLPQIEASQQKPKSLVEVMKELEAKIRQEKGQEEINKWLKSLRSQAKIVIKDKSLVKKKHINKSEEIMDDENSLSFSRTRFSVCRHG